MADSTVITPIASALATIAGGVSGVTAYAKDPGLQGLDGNPTAVVGVPAVNHGELDADPQIGSRIWTLDYPVNIFVDLDVAQDAVTLLIDTVEAFVKAVDADDQLVTADATLSGLVVAARVTSAEPGRDDRDTARPRLFYECNTRVEAYVS